MAFIRSMVDDSVKAAIDQAVSTAARAAIDAFIAERGSPHSVSTAVSNDASSSPQQQTASLPVQATTAGLNSDHQGPSSAQELPRFLPTEYSQVLQQLHTGPQPSSTAHLGSYDDIPAQYVRDIQSGEFFELSKLLPKNLSPMNTSSLEPVTLTLENSVIRVSRNTSSTSITNRDLKIRRRSVDDDVKP